jgi:hypothetical protein
MSGADSNIMAVSGTSPASKSSKKRKVEKMELDMGKASESLWLCKVPEFLGQQLVRANHDDIVGKLKITVKSGGPGKPKVKVTTVQLNEREELILDEEEVAIPKDYTLEDTAVGDDVRMIAFSSNGASDVAEGSEGFKLHGKITKQMVLRPDGAQYVFCSFFLFLLCDVSVSLLSIYCCPLAFSDTTRHDV